MTLYLCRHGRTSRNLDRQYYGRLDPPLCPEGEADSIAIARALKVAGVSPDIYWCSTMTRSRQTLDLIRHHLNPTLAPKIIYDADWNERDFGIWEGLTADQVARQDPQTWDHFIQAPLTTTPQGAEAFLAFTDRVLRGFDRYRALLSSDIQVVMVGHLGALRVLVSRRLNPGQDFWQIAIEAGQVYPYPFPLTRSTGV